MGIVYLNERIFSLKKGCRSEKKTNDGRTKWIVQRNEKKSFVIKRKTN